MIAGFFSVIAVVGGAVVQSVQSSRSGDVDCFSYFEKVTQLVKTDPGQAELFTFGLNDEAFRRESVACMPIRAAIFRRRQWLSDPCSAKRPPPPVPDPSKGPEPSQASAP